MADNLENNPPMSQLGQPDLTPDNDRDEDDSPQAGGFDLRGEESRRLAAYWKDQIKQVDDDQQRWLRRGRMIERRYRDERNRVDEEGVKRYASLWANTETLYPAIYGKAPVPICERRFRDRDPAGRGAAQILERGLRNEIEINGFDDAVGQAVKDYLLPGRGVAWVRYEPEIEEGVSIPAEYDLDMRDSQGDIEPEDDSEAEEKYSATGDRVARESCPVDYINWADFYSFPPKARIWREVCAGAKRVYMTRDQMKKRFGELAGKEIPLQREDPERRGQRGRPPSAESEADERGCVYEIWNRSDEEVVWVAEGYDFLCDRQPDPLQLENFFPFPKPLFANRTNSTLIPVAEYMMYQDQALQIDQLVQRIDMLSRACKVAGIYNAANKDIARLLDESVENELVPVDHWAANAEKGGIAGQIAYLPLKEIIGVINELQTQLEKVMAMMDRLTGITDIMRGTGDARETLGGQRLKSNNGGTRLSQRQNEVARFCRDIIRIMADIMSMHFSPQSLIEASGALEEEGLGAVDMPSLTALQSPPAGAPGAPLLAQPQAPGPPTPQLAGPAPAAPPSVPPQAPGGAAGSNIVPFPGGPQGPMSPSMGAQPPGPGLGRAPPMPGPMGPPPEVLEKLQALKKISDSIRLLRDQRLRGFRVDVEVDSTIYGDAAQEKADRVEFITATTKFLQVGQQLAMATPEIVPLLGKMLQFGTRGFRVGRDLETAIEDFVDLADQAAKKKANAPPQPNPEQLKLQADADKARADAQNAQQRNAVDAKKADIDLQTTQIGAQADQAKAAAEVERQKVEAQSEAANSQADLQQAAADVEMRKMEIQIQLVKLQIEHAKVMGQAQQQAHERAMPPNPPQVGAGGL